MKSDEEEMLALIKEFNEKWTEELARIGSNFPPDPPNAACHHAVITGLRLTNSTWMNGNPPMLPAPGDLVEFFRAGSESIKIWTDKKDHESLLLVDIEPNSVTAGIWRTSAVLLELTIALSCLQEHSHDLGYAWIYHFQPGSPFDQQELLEELDGYRTGNSIIQTSITGSRELTFWSCSSEVRRSSSHRSCCATPSRAIGFASNVP